jgi:hypothetical protein
MRLIVFILVAFVVAGPAAAQNWQEYSYPNYSFRVVSGRSARQAPKEVEEQARKELRRLGSCQDASLT